MLYADSTAPDRYTISASGIAVPPDCLDRLLDLREARRIGLCEACDDGNATRVGVGRTVCEACRREAREALADYDPADGWDPTACVADAIGDRDACVAEPIADRLGFVMRSSWGPIWHAVDAIIAAVESDAIIEASPHVDDIAEHLGDDIADIIRVAIGLPSCDCPRCLP